MRTLSYTSSNDTSVLLYDDKSAKLLKSITIGDDVEYYNQKVVFQALYAGDYVVKFNVADAFSTTGSLNYKIHAFYNWAPVAAVKSCSLSGSTLSIDMSSSYDADAKYGGAVSYYLVYITGEQTMQFNSSDINVLLSPQQISSISNGFSVAVIDNDGAISSKVNVKIS
jgi:hypothetical protein